MNRQPARLFSPGSWPEAVRIAQILRNETIGGVLLLAAAVTALVWANSPWSAAYDGLRDVSVGPAALHLDLTLAEWAADGLLAIFFFVAGLELKREFVAGDLRDPGRAAVPVAAAVAGALVPAALFIVINLGAGPGAVRGWAIPTATDIAFALAVLAVIGRHLPAAMRTFLLTLAVVDDLLAIIIIAVFYTQALSIVPLLAALVPVAAFGVLVQRRQGGGGCCCRSPSPPGRWSTPPECTPPSPASCSPAPSRSAAATGRAPGWPSTSNTDGGPCRRGLPCRSSPSSPPASPSVGSADWPPRPPTASPSASSPAWWPAKPWASSPRRSWWPGSPGPAWPTSSAWVDVVGLALLGGIGFTVSLLIGELAYGAGSERDQHVKVAVLAGSLLAALAAAVVLRLRNRVYRRLAAAECVDADHDQIPDVYQHRVAHRGTAPAQT